MSPNRRSTARQFPCLTFGDSVPSATSTNLLCANQPKGGRHRHRFEVGNPRKVGDSHSFLRAPKVGNHCKFLALHLWMIGQGSSSAPSPQSESRTAHWRASANRHAIERRHRYWNPSEYNRTTSVLCIDLSLRRYVRSSLSWFLHF
jgi:hypothetical protein